MGDMIDPRIDFDGVGVQRGQRHMQKLIQVRPPPPCFLLFLDFPRIRKKEIVHPRIPHPDFLENNQLSILRCVLVRASDIRIGP